MISIKIAIFFYRQTLHWPAFMRFFSLSQDLTLDTDKFTRAYTGAPNPQEVAVDKLYLQVGNDTLNIAKALKQRHLEQNPITEATPTDAAPPDLKTLGLHFVDEATLLAWPHLPTRLGRISSRCVGAGLHQHTEAQALPAQLQALRNRKPGQQHFRLALVNGFGTNLGDNVIGMAAFRHVLHCLAQHLPSVSYDVLFGPGHHPDNIDIVGYEPACDQVLFQGPTLAEFAHYDAYFDFTGLINLPQYDAMPTVDWFLWWCGLDHDSIAAEDKRNQGHIRWDAWNAVRALLRDKPGKKLLFNPKASVPLRTIPADVAGQFAQRLLELDPEIKLVVDQPIALQHQRLIDLSGQIDSPEKFKALVGLVDGLITVNSLASHVADLCATPAVHMCSTLPASHYPYYPFSAAINPKDYAQLPAFNKAKVPDEEWEKISAQYHAAWQSISPVEVLTLLRQKMAQRQAASHQPQGLRLVADKAAPSCVSAASAGPRLNRQKLTAEHAYASQRFAQLASNFLKPGSVCVLACAPEPTLAVALERRVAPYGQLITIEPRALLARSLEASLFAASAWAARVQQTLALGGIGANEASFPALNPWSESSSGQWGNSHQKIPVANQTIDQMALLACACLIVQSPMPFGQFIAGAIETLQRCRPFVLMSPLSREEVASVCTAALPANYDFWAESALPGQDLNSMLVLGLPKEKNAKINGFSKINLE